LCWVGKLEKKKRKDGRPPQVKGMKQELSTALVPARTARAAA